MTLNLGVAIALGIIFLIWSVWFYGWGVLKTYAQVGVVIGFAAFAMIAAVTHARSNEFLVIEPGEYYVEGVVVFGVEGGVSGFMSCDEEFYWVKYEGPLTFIPAGTETVCDGREPSGDLVRLGHQDMPVRGYLVADNPFIVIETCNGRFVSAPKTLTVSDEYGSCPGAEDDGKGGAAGLIVILFFIFLIVLAMRR